MCVFVFVCVWQCKLLTLSSTDDAAQPTVRFLFPILGLSSSRLFRLSPCPYSIILPLLFYFLMPSISFYPFNLSPTFRFSYIYPYYVWKKFKDHIKWHDLYYSCLSSRLWKVEKSDNLRKNDKQPVIIWQIK